MSESTEAKVSDGAREAAEEIMRLLTTSGEAVGHKRFELVIQRLAVAPVEAERDRFKNGHADAFRLGVFHQERADKAEQERDALSEQVAQWSETAVQYQRERDEARTELAACKIALQHEEETAFAQAKQAQEARAAARELRACLTVRACQLSSWQHEYAVGGQAWKRCADEIQAIEAALEKTEACATEQEGAAQQKEKSDG